MRLVVVDPRILVRAFVHPHSDPARLLALLAYGRVSINADGQPLDEVAEMVDSAHQRGVEIDIAAVRGWAERDVEDAKYRKALMEDALEQHVPCILGMATSPPLLTELLELAHKEQGEGNLHVHPDRVRRLVTRHALSALTELSPAPIYLERGRISEHDYLIHTATEARARDLITDDLKTMACAGPGAMA